VPFGSFVIVPNLGVISPKTIIFEPTTVYSTPARFFEPFLPFTKIRIIQRLVENQRAGAARWSPATTVSNRMVYVGGRVASGRAMINLDTIVKCWMCVATDAKLSPLRRVKCLINCSYAGSAGTGWLAKGRTIARCIGQNGADTHTHTHTHTFNGPFSGTTRVIRYQKDKTNLDFTEAGDSEWQWHQLGHMQVCT